jgi:hypothetical protein
MAFPISFLQHFLSPVNAFQFRHLNTHMYFNILLLFTFTTETDCILCEVRTKTKEMQVVERRASEMKDFKRLDVNVKRLQESQLIQYSCGRWKIQ